MPKWMCEEACGWTGDSLPAETRKGHVLCPDCLLQRGTMRHLNLVCTRCGVRRVERAQVGEAVGPEALCPPCQGVVAHCGEGPVMRG